MSHCTSTTSTGEREALLRRYLPLVRLVARGMRARAGVSADLDDLVSWGILGLLAALDRYDPARETLFSTYARFRIRGAILDQLRALDWVPRSVRARLVAVDRATRSLEARLGRPPREEELAAALGLSVGAYRRLRGEIAPAGMDRVDDAAGDEVARVPLERTEPSPLALLLRRERFHRVGEAIRHLPVRDQLLLSLYYRDDLTMKKVGAVLGLTESRVSQLHTRVLRRLRSELVEQQPLVAHAG
jgi:RNA polymerase sigma factor for flagellar operon FliA